MPITFVILLIIALVTYWYLFLRYEARYESSRLNNPSSASEYLRKTVIQSLEGKRTTISISQERNGYIWIYVVIRLKREGKNTDWVRAVSLMPKPPKNQGGYILPISCKFSSRVSHLNWIKFCLEQCFMNKVEISNQILYLYPIQGGLPVSVEL